MVVIRMKLAKQITSLILVAALFIAFNLSVYVLVTRRCANNFSVAGQGIMIEVENYLPFDEDSRIVKLDSATKLTGDLPVLDGAAALLPVYSAFVNAVYPADSCEFDGADYTDGSAMQYGNTGVAFRGVADGTVDIAFCAAPSEGQKQYAAERNAELVLVPIGLEAFVFIVNADNPVDGLTADQIRGMYSGRITNWNEVGGPDRLINPLQRIEGSGSQTALHAFMQDEELYRSPFAFLGGTIGFSFRYYVDGIVKNEGVKMLAVNGVYPDAENIKNGTYPIVSEFYAIYRADNDNPNVKFLIDWILSEEGQRIVEESGYVAIN